MVTCSDFHVATISMQETTSEGFRGKKSQQKIWASSKSWLVVNKKPMGRFVQNMFLFLENPLVCNFFSMMEMESSRIDGDFRNTAMRPHVPPKVLTKGGTSLVLDQRLQHLFNR